MELSIFEQKNKWQEFQHGLFLQNFVRHAINAADEKPLTFTLINITFRLENTLINKLIFFLTTKAVAFLWAVLTDQKNWADQFLLHRQFYCCSQMGLAANNSQDLYLRSGFNKYLSYGELKFFSLLKRFQLLCQAQQPENSRWCNSMSRCKSFSHQEHLSLHLIIQELEYSKKQFKLPIFNIWAKHINSDFVCEKKIPSGFEGTLKPNQLTFLFVHSRKVSASFN